MSESSENLALPYIMPAQAQKHVTHNEAIRMLDALVHIELTGIGTNTPPASPAEGERHAIGDAPTDAWDGKAGHLAAWQDGAWAFFAPQKGWLALDASADRIVFYDGNAWAPAVRDPDALQNLLAIGVGTTADANNKLAVASPATLLTHDGSNHQLKINKNAETDTSSILFQSGWSGRAEFGLTGDDDFHVKVSADGGQWSEAIIIDGQSGAVQLPATHAATHNLINLLADGGRLASGDVNQISIGTFQWPSYFILQNGTTAAGLGKAVYDTSTYGGAGDALTPSAQDLVEKIRDVDYRRYGNEFWIAELTHGADQTSSTVHGATTFHLSTHTWFQPRPSHLTFHCYLRAIDQDVVVQQFDDKIIFIDGVMQSGSVTVTPADGWVSIAIRDARDPRQLDGHSSSLFYLYAQSAGDRYQIACPALLAGIIPIDPSVGPIAPAGIWS